MPTPTHDTVVSKPDSSGVGETYQWRTPASAEVADGETLEPFDFTGFVCVDPKGAPYWPSAHVTAEESMRYCFGPPDRRWLDDLAREGWRCVPIGPLDKAENR